MIPRQQLKKLRPALKLEPTKLRPKTYTGEAVQPCTVLPLYHSRLALPDCKWLVRLRLDCDCTCTVHKLSDGSQPNTSHEELEARLRGLQAKYSIIFDGTLGKIGGEQA